MLEKFNLINFQVISIASFRYGDQSRTSDLRLSFRTGIKAVLQVISITSLRYRDQSRTSGPHLSFHTGIKAVLQVISIASLRYRDQSRTSGPHLSFHTGSPYFGSMSLLLYGVTVLRGYFGLNLWF